LEATPLLVDVFEPIEILNFLSQSVDVKVSPLNAGGLLDYFWVTDHSITIERKSVGDLIGSIKDDSLEKRLILGLQHADECGLLVEGFMSPHGKGTVWWKSVKGGKFQVPYRTYATPYHEIQAVLYRYDKLGISCYHTSDYFSTAVTLVSTYNNSKKDEHRTFQRYLKKKPNIMKPNPYIETLMGLSGVQVGEVRAKALIKEFGTPFGVFCQDGIDLMQVDGIGKKLAEDILRSIGRL